MITQSVAHALLTYEANRNSRNENGNGNDNGNGSHDSGDGSRMSLNTTHGCTYKELLNSQPLNFKGIEGAVGLAYWFEKMESLFHISNCAVECQVKYATCTLLGGALTWWNSHVRTVGHDAAYEMSWKSLMKMMTKAYCPRNEIQKLDNELWNLTVKSTDLLRYTQCFQELALLCPRMVPDEEDKVESLMDQKVRVHAARQADNKRRIESNPRDDHVQQPTYKRQNVARAYTAGPGEKKEYTGTLPLSLAAITNQRALVAYQRTLNCFECGKQRHYRSECPELKNQNYGNQAGISEARGRVYALGGGEADQDPSNIANNADA
ncbi:reverse transcriptase domain-containing protein [Tanacetum coccineum]